MGIIIGREHEKAELKRYYEANSPQLIAIYGRRRVGKTYFINNFFNFNFFFTCTGARKERKNIQIKHFLQQLDSKENCSSWSEAFWLLREKIKNSSTSERKVIFIDEISWFDTPKSGFIQAFEYFWNSFCSNREDILFIICGSSTSWIINKIFKNVGGLYNRVTGRLAFEPFTLYECNKYFEYRNVNFTKLEVLQAYMIFGGIPYYLNYFNHLFSFTQNIDRLLFKNNSPLKAEYQELFCSLFENDERYRQIIDILSNKIYGLTRKEIANLLKHSEGGNLTVMLQNLEASGIIRQYSNFPNRQKDAIYQLIDNFCFFYNKVIKNNDINDENFWSNYIDTGKYYNWRGYAFEIVCLIHTKQIKLKLGISGIYTTVYSWRNQNCQIDLVFKRADKVFNICEIKYTNEPYTINQEDFENIHNKIREFRTATKTYSAILTTLVSIYPLNRNKYSNVIEREITLEDLMSF
ncbi:MAG: ATP-binding protein [Bacillales bacterium]|jgi:predicted AAA+ superfamily ATPase|nr:ATP-binding protein [Bacillales bacterium]